MNIMNRSGDERNLRLSVIPINYWLEYTYTRHPMNANQLSLNLGQILQLVPFSHFIG